MKEAQINQIIESLIDNTKDNSIFWKLSKGMFNSTRSYEFETFSMDNLTKFTMNLNLDDSFNLSKGSLLCIYNDKLPDKSMYVGQSSYRNLTILEQLLYDKYIDKSLLIDIEPILDDILNNIGNKEKNRDRKLEEILKTEPIVNVEHIKKTFLQKLGL